MSVSSRERLLILFCLLFATAIFVTGITWGLPSRAADPYLFGDRTPWTGAEILQLAPLVEDPNRGADVDADPLVGRDQVIQLNETDKQRAEIVRRYRLFTYQPDEYNTMKSLSGMNPGKLQLDPRMYQYGGLWVYPVGGLLKIASIAGIVDLKNDKAYYLDHPEAFARFYVIARLYSAAWGVIGAWAVYLLARKLTGHMVPAAVASACWAMMPVVVNMAHEAKPHLAGLVLMLLAILAACRYVETGARRWWIIAGALCGAAFGMVISSLIIFSILPVMTLFRPDPWKKRIGITIGACAAGGVVYALTNPYVWINALTNATVLRSNIGTSTGMYSASPGEGLWNALKLVHEGAGPMALVAIFGLFFFYCETRGPGKKLSANFWLLFIPASIVAIQFVALAAGKSGEYGRFALLPNTFICLIAVAGLWFSASTSRVSILRTIGFLLLPTMIFGTNYLFHFIADAKKDTTRFAVARQLQQLNTEGAGRLAVVAEPAPYVMPPVDLWQWELVLLPLGSSPTEVTFSSNADVLLRAVDLWPREVPDGFKRISIPETAHIYRNAAQISWAAKPFEILVAQSPPATSGVAPDRPAATPPSPAPAQP